MTPYIDVDGARAGVRAYRVIQATLRETRDANEGRGRYRDYGYSFDVSGTADETQHIARGGVYGAKGDRVAFGIAPADASRLAGALRRMGCKLRNADADALLLQAEMGALQCLATTPAQERTKKANRREKARAQGLCIVCATRPAREGRATCQECSDAAAERTMARRKAKRAGC